ncbi:hypothetical protein [Pseudomonas fluorescens]|uniref:Uncharacterized protein n=1 Tax=Pseudomonas fluorescens TaxID=294 RepID=A0A5E7S5N5_PSEFL|nr:hypothetical protein [Pseudomonas fluorescens]VVP78383.1 hypothetical protein PS928_00475 [Pseudomonas fluorescens]
MAIQATVTTVYGEERLLYIRLNNMETSNHGVTSQAKFRGFLSMEAYDNKNHFMWEQDIEFIADVSQPLWPQAYEALKAEADLTDAVDLMD